MYQAYLPHLAKVRKKVVWVFWGGLVWYFHDLFMRRVNQARSVGRKPTKVGDSPAPTWSQVRLLENIYYSCERDIERFMSHASHRECAEKCLLRGLTRVDPRVPTVEEQTQLKNRLVQERFILRVTDMELWEQSVLWSLAQKLGVIPVPNAHVLSHMLVMTLCRDRQPFVMDNRYRLILRDEMGHTLWTQGHSDPSDNN